MKRRIIWVFVALFFAAILIFASISFYNTYQVYEHGHLIMVEVESIPSTISSKGVWIKFNIRGGLHEIKVGSNLAQTLRKGDGIEVKYLEGYEDHFLLPNENPMYGGILSVMVPLIFG